MGSIEGRPAELVVRQAGPQDAEAIGHVRHASWQAAYAGLMPADYLAGLSVDGFVLAAQRMFANLEAIRGTVFVAEADGFVVGFAGVGRCRDDDASGEGELHAIYLDPEVWGTGIGRRLQDVALQRLREDGYHDATLWVLAANAGSRAFYERTGWRLDGRVSGLEVGAEVLDEVRYRRTL